MQPDRFGPCHDGVDYLIWSLTGLLLFIGLVGSVVPLVPGTALMLAGVLLHKLLLPETVGWPAIGWIAFFFVLSVIVDFAGVLIGTRMFGGSKWGMTGASGGAFIGMFFSLPALLIGTFLGAVAAEKYVAKRAHRASFRAGVGATVGFLLSTVARLACAFVMVGLFLLDTLTRTIPAP